MGSITTLRPSSTTSGVGWTPSTGTLHGVTSDDSDATYATWGGSGSALILATPVDAPPAGERRHQVRLRMRGEDGDAWGAVRLASGALVAGAAAPFTSSPGTVTGAWGFGAPPDGSTVLSTYVTGQASGVRIEELYIDMDSREAPTFTPQILNGAGSSVTTVSDTAQPVVHASSIDLDGLNARAYRYWITLNGAIVWDTGTLSGTATDQQVTVLDNGAYTLHAQIWTTLGQNTAYNSDEETLDFTMSVSAIPAPDSPVVSPVTDTPFYELAICAPYAGDFDDDVAWLEIQRVDCPHGGYLLLNGVIGSHASTPSTAPFTDIELTVRASRDDNWMPASDEVLAAKYNSGGNNRGVIFGLDGLTGNLYLTWSPDGLFVGSQITVTSTEAPIMDVFGNATLRAFLDVDDGAGGYAVTFDQQDEAGVWHQIGDVVSNAGGGTTAVFQSGQNLEVGSRNDGLSERWNGRIYEAQFRDGRAGTIFASPDFTGHNAGTTSITDDQGNVWTIHSPASLTSDQRLTTVAILGPLETDECAAYTDYSLPRSGMGADCDHQPDPCCSYYRARTLGRVDGQLLISNWSDAFDPGVPNGMIFMWADTAASIPAGWDRVTDLDSRYPKGIATSSTEPGTTGGAATHTHTLGSHTHDTSHLHTTTGNTTSITGTQTSAPNQVGTANALSSHGHTRPSTASATVVSGGTTGTAAAGNNDPARLDVIFIQSNGQPLGVPDGALGLSPDTSLSGWADYANATNRFLKGAAPAGNGGATTASALASHVHSVASHTHTGTSHAHTSANTGNFSSANSLTAGATAVLSATTHAHPITVGSQTSAALAASSATDTGSTSADDPPYRNVRVQENTSGGESMPVGIIGIWRGSLGAIPDFWHLCDGTNGTLNLVARYPRGATASINTTGGSLNTHTHTGASHTHTTSGHSHTETVGSAGAATANVVTTATVTVSTGTHTHTLADTNSTTPTVASSSGTVSSVTNEPPYEEVAFVQLIEEPSPPPTPELFCLDWNDNEHLIRTEGPDGPMWAAVGGMFTWDVDRPFTSATGVMGSRFVTSAEPGGRNMHMSAGVESEAELATLMAVLNRPLVLISPSDAEEVWAAPVGASVRVIKIGRVRQVTADFIATGPQPAPQFADVG